MATPRSRTRSPGIMKYTYMFEADKSPTLQFNALLRAIARYIVSHIGDKTDVHLTPKKLAAFYKAVGGNYDPLFFDTPYETISYMWTVTGCQHSLQPTGINDYAAPSVPALTERGFSRWESVEVLLGPEEHVPFIQYAVSNWGLRHPDTGEIFPPNLPADVFPRRPDAQIDLWHKSCANEMRAAASKEETMPKPEPKSQSRPQPPPPPQPQPQPQQQPKPSFQPQPQAKTEQKPEPASEREPKYVYVHTTTARDPFQTTPPRSRASDTGFFERQDRQPFTYVHIGGGGASGGGGGGGGGGRPGPGINQRATRQSPEKSAPRERPSDETRRRSFSDYGSPQHHKREQLHQTYSGTYLSPESGRPRRHSQPRHHSSESSADETSPDHTDFKTRRRQRNGSPQSVRRGPPPTAPIPPPAAAEPSPGFRNHRSEIRPDDPRRRSSPLSSIREKLGDATNHVLPNGHSHSHGHSSDRTRNSSRQSSANDPIRTRRSREQVPPSRLSQNFSDLASEGSSGGELGENEHRRRRRERDQREQREQERERERYRGDRGRARDFDRERADERESSGRRDRHFPRMPETERRPSSLADAERRREPVSWDRENSLRERDRLRDERRKWDRRSPEEDLSPTGVIPGRRYPEPTYG
ncbi:hypothetical protein PT974_05941 [Cladobotryum mycophilum]|uniref:DUF7514 domain-containing protein n=1 Tax=Cladobotryum mycophilum TaxID=491253 RepID=A0ABR0SK48_9HYPO